VTVARSEVAAGFPAQVVGWRQTRPVAQELLDPSLFSIGCRILLGRELAELAISGCVPFVSRLRRAWFDVCSLAANLLARKFNLMPTGAAISPLRRWLSKSEAPRALVRQVRHRLGTVIFKRCHSIDSESEWTQLRFRWSESVMDIHTDCPMAASAVERV